MADSFTVTDPGDAPDAAPDGVCEATAATGDCTLRAALDEANATPDVTDAIAFEGAVDLVTVATQLEIKEPVSITGNGGAGPDETVVSGADLTRVFEIADGADTTFAAMVVSDGLAGGDSGGGGAIRTAAATELDDVTVSSSSLSGLTSSGYGAGISGVNPLASLTLRGSRVLGNSITVDDGGGGSTTVGGGAGIASLGPLTVTDSTVEGNSVHNDGTSVAEGAGIRADGAVGVLRSTISGNTMDGTGAGEGAALYGGTATGERTITNSTISGNTTQAGLGGGAIEMQGDATLTAVTFASNAGEAADLDARSGTVTAGNTIFGSANACGTSGGSISPGVVGHNLDAGTSCGLGTLNGNQESVDPMLAPLALNAPGSTKTHALLPGSPALDAASNDCAGLIVDQRGFARSQGGPTCDVGAYEAQQHTLTVTRAGTGSGGVTAPGIICGSDCSDSYVEGSSIVLTAAEGTDSSFDSWSGCDSVAGNECTVAMGSDRMVLARFTLDSTPPVTPPPSSGNTPLPQPKPKKKKCRKGTKRLKGKCTRVKPKL